MTLQPVWHWRALFTRFVAALAIIGTATAGGFAYAFWYANNKIVHGTHHVSVGPLPTVKSTDPSNYLIVGSDSRQFVKDPVAADHFGTTRTNPENLADVIMIAHVDPNAPGRGFLVSIPRDTWVPVPGHGTQKINAAFNFGNGPKLLIETIQNNFGFKINHYLKLDFATFTDVVNAIGHVQISFPAPAYDTFTGLKITAAGCQSLTGLQALAYARSRHYYELTTTGYKPDQTQDIGRIQRQQYFIRSLAQEAIKKGARNALTAKKLLDKIVPHLVVDDHMGFQDFIRLVRAFHSVDPGAVRMVTVPTKRVKFGSVDAQQVITEQAQPIFALLGSFDTPAKPASTAHVTPAHVRVLVLNGSNVKGIASSTATALRSAGFASGGTPTDADQNDYKYTVIRYTAGNLAQARLVASYLHGVGFVTQSPTSAMGSGRADVVVVTGHDFAGVVRPGTHTKTTTTVASTHDSIPGIPASRSGRPAVGCSL